MRYWYCNGLAWLPSRRLHLLPRPGDSLVVWSGGRRSCEPATPEMMTSYASLPRRHSRRKSRQTEKWHKQAKMRSIACDLVVISCCGTRPHNRSSTVIPHSLNLICNRPHSSICRSVDLVAVQYESSPATFWAAPPNTISERGRRHYERERYAFQYSR